MPFIPVRAAKACAVLSIIVTTSLVPARCGGAPTDATTVSHDTFAYRETQALSRRICSAIPRDILARSLARVGDRSLGGPGDPAGFDDNSIALLYVEDVSIKPIPLQRAAYEGCIAGLKD